MSSIAPQVRKHLSADALFRLGYSRVACLPEHRLDDTEISFRDALMSALAMFALKTPSLLACDKERAEGHVHTIDGMERVPCDTQMRAILAPVSPKGIRPVFQSVLRQRQRSKTLEAMTFLEGHDLLALDGTEDFASQTMHGASCLHRVHRNGASTDAHHDAGVFGGPDPAAVLCLMPRRVGEAGQQAPGGERRRSLCYPYHLDAMRDLVGALWDGFEQSRPILIINPASSLPLF